MELKFLIILSVVNIVYLVLGGVIFHLIEKPEEDKSRQAGKTNLLKLEQTLSNNISCLTAAELDSLIRQVVKLYDDGEISVDDESDWSLSGSIFFASTVVTTVGYGHITLGTGAGRIFCCFYALLGIPLCLTMLGEVGKRLNNAGKSLNDKLNKGVLPPKIGQFARAGLIFVIGFGLFILIPGVIMTAVEDTWNYGTAVYYGLITLTTIGFGDVVAGQDSDKDYGWWYSILLTIWIMTGLAWAATMIANLQELYQSVIHPEDPEEGDVEKPVEQETVSTKEELPLVDNMSPVSYTTEKTLPQP